MITNDGPSTLLHTKTGLHCTQDWPFTYAAVALFAVIFLVCLYFCYKKRSALCGSRSGAAKNSNIASSYEMTGGYRI
jgi:hypothetical protein